MTRPVVAILTDFGTADHYVGAMKGVILSICPDATLVDLTHDVPAHDVMAGALELAACWRFFRPGTIFLAVVDPGVGTSRGGLVAEAGGARFVAPDNGLLTAVFDECPPSRVVALTDARYRRPVVSKTFEGRDRFAPAAGWLAAGVAPDAFGDSLDGAIRLALPRPIEEDGRISGCVLTVDRFGNLITNIRRDALDRLGPGSTLRVSIGQTPVGAWVDTYAEAMPGETCALVGSTDRLEIAVNGGRAVDRTGAGRGTAVTVVRLSAAMVR
ncbi:MAG: SAM-dependent chlorinase/fluorinase [Acidobacteriota bacterium]